MRTQDPHGIAYVRFYEDCEEHKGDSTAAAPAAPSAPVAEKTPQKIGAFTLLPEEDEPPRTNLFKSSGEKRSSDAGMDAGMVMALAFPSLLVPPFLALLLCIHSLKLSGTYSAASNAQLLYGYIRAVRKPAEGQSIDLLCSPPSYTTLHGLDEPEP